MSRPEAKQRPNAQAKAKQASLSEPSKEGWLQGARMAPKMKPCNGAMA
jgi:hypothetical protein